MSVLKASRFSLLLYLLLIWSGRVLACVEGDAGAGDYLPLFTARDSPFLILNGILLVLAVMARFLRRRYFPQCRLSPLLVGLVACVSILLGGVASLLVPAFDAIYTAHCGRPPSFAWLVDFRWLLWLPAVTALLAWLGAKSEVARCRVFGAILLVGINALQLALILCYSPIFSFGCV